MKKMIPSIVSTTIEDSQAETPVEGQWRLIRQKKWSNYLNVQ